MNQIWGNPYGICTGYIGYILRYICMYIHVSVCICFHLGAVSSAYLPVYRIHTGTYIDIWIDSGQYICACMWLYVWPRYIQIWTWIYCAGCSSISARLTCSLCAFAVLSLQVHRDCAVAARCASKVLRGRCTLAARVAHEKRHKNRQFYSDQVRATG